MGSQFAVILVLLMITMDVHSSLNPFIERFYGGKPLKRLMRKGFHLVTAVKCGANEITKLVLYTFRGLWLLPDASVNILSLNR